MRIEILNMRFEILDLRIVRKPVLTISFIIISILSFSQQLVYPNFALASHPMKVTKISTSANKTIISLSIENQIEAGSFCADKNIFAQDVLTGKKYRLKKI